MLLLAILASTSLAATPTRRGVDDDAFRTAIIALHNAERDEVGSRPLRWNAELARDAAVWADALAASGDFDHDPDNEEQGENLWMGTRGHYSLEDMVEGWSEEKAPLRRMRSWEQNHHAVGHYTQMVWSGTTSVGCAVSRNRSDEFLVCRYDPAGNVMGESPYASGGMSTPRR